MNELLSKRKHHLSTIADRRAIIERVRQENESDYGDRARRAVQKLLSASLPHPWTYVYELTQNALDACAQRATDHFGLSVEREMSEDQDQGTSRGNRGGRMDDHKARQAVIDYEISQGRKPKEMPDNQPGYDVLSVDSVSGKRRRIEVKGVQGIFQADASVVLTARQAHDAIQHSEQRSETNDEYWLYVVDSTETANPRVFPIPWTRYRLRYGFYARVWADIAEQPTA